MEDIAKFALSIDDLDENFYEIYIKALYYQKNYQEAIQTYRSTIDYLYRHLGTKPSEKMYQLFELIKKENHDAGTDIIDIQNELMNDSNRGAYLCEYGTFKELYTIESRMIQRLGICAHICLVTVNDSMLLEKNKAKNKEVVEKTMQKIQTALVNGLRVGDVVSRFSANQFIVLLASCSYENAQMAMDRVLRKINYTLNNKNLSIDLSIDEVLPQVKEA